MEAVMSEFRICPSVKELPRLKSASAGEQGVNSGSMSDWCSLETTLSSGKRPLQDSRASAAENSCSRGKALRVSCAKGKAVVYTGAVDGRLRILEEETETMKRELFQCAEERKKLMNEIYQQFQILEIDPRFSAILSTHAELLADCFNDEFGGETE